MTVRRNSLRARRKLPALAGTRLRDLGDLGSLVGAGLLLLDLHNRTQLLAQHQMLLRLRHMEHPGLRKGNRRRLELGQELLPGDPLGPADTVQLLRRRPRHTEELADLAQGQQPGLGQRCVLRRSQTEPPRVLGRLRPGKIRRNWHQLCAHPGAERSLVP